METSSTNSVNDSFSTDEKYAITGLRQDLKSPETDTNDLISNSPESPENPEFILKIDEENKFLDLEPDDKPKKSENFQNSENPEDLGKSEKLIHNRKLPEGQWKRPTRLHKQQASPGRRTGSLTGNRSPRNTGKLPSLVEDAGSDSGGHMTSSPRRRIRKEINRRKDLRLYLQHGLFNDGEKYRSIFLGEIPPEEPCFTVYPANYGYSTGEVIVWQSYVSFTDHKGSKLTIPLEKVVKILILPPKRLFLKTRNGEFIMNMEENEAQNCADLITQLWKECIPYSHRCMLCQQKKIENIVVHNQFTQFFSKNEFL